MNKEMLLGIMILMSGCSSVQSKNQESLRDPAFSGIGPNRQTYNLYGQDYQCRGFYRGQFFDGITFRFNSYRPTLSLHAGRKELASFQEIHDISNGKLHPRAVEVGARAFEAQSESEGAVSFEIWFMHERQNVLIGDFHFGAAAAPAPNLNEDLRVFEFKPQLFCRRL